MFSRGNKKASIGLLVVTGLLFQFSYSYGNLASATDLTGQYDCNSGEKVADLDDPSHPVTPYYEIYMNVETLTVRSGTYCMGVIIIPSGVDEIEDFAFRNSLVTEVRLPNTVRSIGIQAFKDSHLSKINLPEGMLTISNSSFKNSMLTEITIPDSVEAIENDAFYNIAELETVNLGNGVKTIGPYAFALTGIENLRLPPTVETVETNAFSSTSLVQIYIPQSVNTVNNQAFAYNSHLLYLSVTDSLTTLANDAFASSNMGSVDTSYCGTGFLDTDGKFFGSTSTCRSPSNISVSTTSSNASKSITLSVGQALSHGGAPITKFELLDSDGQLLQTLEYSRQPVFVLNDQPTGKNLRFRIKAENSVGLYGLSNLTESIVFRTQTEESEEVRRVAEIKRQQEILKSRENSLTKIKSGEWLSLEDFSKSALDGVSADNYSRVQDRIKKTLDAANPKIQEIEKAIKYVVTVDSVCLKLNPPLNIQAQTLVEIGLISLETKHKIQIWHEIKQTPLISRQDELALIALIDQIQAVIDERKNRLDQLKARAATRKSIS
jgi:hypothetical protein